MKSVATFRSLLGNAPHPFHRVGMGSGRGIDEVLLMVHSQVRIVHFWDTCDVEISSPAIGNNPRTRDRLSAEPLIFDLSSTV